MVGSISPNENQNGCRDEPRTVRESQVTVMIRQWSGYHHECKKKAFRDSAYLDQPDPNQKVREIRPSAR